MIYGIKTESTVPVRVQAGMGMARVALLALCAGWSSLSLGCLCWTFVDALEMWHHMLSTYVKEHGISSRYSGWSGIECSTARFGL